jgi:aspartate-semialdehyde dehydrogenase
LIKAQRARHGWAGAIVTNPNCSTAGLVMAFAPLHRAFGIKRAVVVTLQALSGAGYPGLPATDMLGNIIPFIGGNEEEKIETEPRKILGTWQNDRFTDAPFRISAQVNRVPTIDGHLLSISLKLRDGGVDLDEIRDAIRNFTGEPQRLNLPLAPKQPVHYASEPDRPQPRLDRDREHGMAVTVGRLRPCPLLDIRMVALVHNTIRGAAGAALLNAELLDAKGLL